MFNFDHDLIMKLIKSRKKDAYITPMYVRNYNERYCINELTQITNFNPSAFKVGFGVHISILDKFSFPNSLIHQFEPITAFSNFDEEKQISERFIIFETGQIDINMLEQASGKLYSVYTTDAANIKETAKLLSKATVTEQETKVSPIDQKVIEQIIYYQGILRMFLSTQQETIRKKRVTEELQNYAKEAEERRQQLVESNQNS